MATRRFYGRIDVSKITKEKIFKGKKGSWLPLVIWLNDEPNQYGNIISVQEETNKEEREAGKKANYLGNFKEAVNSQEKKSEEEKEDLPF